MSSRSLKVAPLYIEPAKLALRNGGFARQTDLAKDLCLCRATVSNFLNGKPVDYLNFLEISQRLGLDWREISHFDEQMSEISSLDEVKFDGFDEEEGELFQYIERPPLESQAMAAILQAGALLRIKAPKRMGKTALINRIISSLKQQGYHLVYLNVVLADGQILSSLDNFLKWFCVIVAQELNLPNQLADYWDDILGSNSNCKFYFEKYLLANLDHPLVLCLDEVDRIFPHPKIAEDFFGLLRAWHEAAKARDIWKKLRLIVAHSTEVYIPLDINRSPFNVGISLELPEFSSLQVKELVSRHKLNFTENQLQNLIYLVNGHPYLIQRAIYHLLYYQITLEELLETAVTDSGIYSDHLQGHLCNLQQYPELKTALKQVIESPEGIRLNSKLAYQLKSLGLVIFQRNSIMIRCNLYQKYFQDRL